MSLVKTAYMWRFVCYQPRAHARRKRYLLDFYEHEHHTKTGSLAVNQTLLGFGRKTARVGDADRHRGPISGAGLYQRADQPVEPSVLRCPAE
ncbi:hypothetical protein D3C75_817420 [compost metagenome]